jgi:hypothetical protein
MSGPVVFRSQWSTVNAKFSALPGAMAEAVQHHTGGAGPGQNLVDWLRGMEAAEMQRGDGLIALAYHWMVISGGPHDGTKIEVRPWGVQGGATLKHNSSSRAVCMSGNFENDQPTEQAMDSTAEVWADGVRRGFVQRVPVRPHSDFFATACCGRNLKARLPDLNARIAEHLDGTSVPTAPTWRLPLIFLTHPAQGTWIVLEGPGGQVSFLSPTGAIVPLGMDQDPSDKAAFGNRTIAKLLARTRNDGKPGFSIVANDNAKYIPKSQI